MRQRTLPTSLTHSPRLATLAAGFFFAAVLGIAPASAERSAWVETQGGGIRLVAGSVQADGALPAILEIRLEPGWRTYWTDPGASGIPPAVTITGKGESTGPDAGTITYSGLRLPVPRHFTEGDLHYVGYDRPVAFPLLIKTEPPQGGTNRAMQIEASVFLGICKSICIPVQATIDLALSPTQDDNRLDAARIKAAFAALPQAPTPDFTVTRTVFDAQRGEIVLTLRLPDGATAPDVFLAGPSGYAFKLPRSTPAADGLTQVTIGTKLPPKFEGRPKDGSILATVSAGGRAMETPLVFGP